MTIRRDRHRFRPWGLFGGQAGPLCNAVLHRADGTEEALPSKKVFEIRAGDVLRVGTTGSGGYGSPLNRDPRAVLNDVLDRRVSPEAAATIYGVVLDGQAVDEAQTAELRARLRATRRAAEVWDRGD